MIHSIGGFQAGVAGVPSMLFDGDEPPITTQSNKWRFENWSGSSIGSIDSQRIGALTFSNARSALVTRAWTSTVVPIQAFAGMSNSAMRFGNLVRKRKFH